MHFIGQIDDFNCSLRFSGQLKLSTSPFKFTLAELFDPNARPPLVPLNALCCTIKGARTVYTHVEEKNGKKKYDRKNYNLILLDSVPVLVFSADKSLELILDFSQGQGQFRMLYILSMGRRAEIQEVLFLSGKCLLA